MCYKWLLLLLLLLPLPPWLLLLLLLLFLSPWLLLVAFIFFPRWNLFVAQLVLQVLNNVLFVVVTGVVARCTFDCAAYPSRYEPIYICTAAAATTSTTMQNIWKSCWPTTGSSFYAQHHCVFALHATYLPLGVRCTLFYDRPVCLSALWCCTSLALWNMKIKWRRIASIKNNSNSRSTTATTTTTNNEKKNHLYSCSSCFFVVLLLVDLFFT